MNNVIDTSNLQIGMTVKNYKELCKILNEEIKAGNSKMLQLKEWSRYFEFERPKWSHSYIILDIYEEPLEKEDDRKKGNRRIFGNENSKEYQELKKYFQVPEEYIFLPGVYKIENDQSIYIGSTTISLARRFSQHFHNNNGNHDKTQNILLNNGLFTCLQSFPLNTDERIIRDAEANYIRKYKNTDKQLLNSSIPEVINSSTTKKTNNIKYENIKVPVDILDEFLDVIRLSGFLIMNKTIYNKQFEPIKE